MFAPPPAVAPPAAAIVEPTPKPKRARPKNDPKLVSAARELRDRYLDHVNAGGFVQPERKSIGVAWTGGRSLEAPSRPLLLIDAEAA